MKKTIVSVEGGTVYPDDRCLATESDMIEIPAKEAQVPIYIKESAAGSYDISIADQAALFSESLITIDVLTGGANSSSLNCPTKIEPSVCVGPFRLDILDEWGNPGAPLQRTEGFRIQNNGLWSSHIRAFADKECNQSLPAINGEEIYYSAMLPNYNGLVFYLKAYTWVHWSTLNISVQSNDESPEISASCRVELINSPIF